MSLKINQIVSALGSSVNAVNDVVFVKTDIDTGNDIKYRKFQVRNCGYGAKDGNFVSMADSSVISLGYYNIVAQIEDGAGNAIVSNNYESYYENELYTNAEAEAAVSSAQTRWSA